MMNYLEWIYPKWYQHIELSQPTQFAFSTKKIVADSVKDWIFVYFYLPITNVHTLRLLISNWPIPRIQTFLLYSWTLRNVKSSLFFFANRLQTHPWELILLACVSSFEYLFDKILENKSQVQWKQSASLS